MTERERLIEIIVTAENEVFRAFPYTNSTKRIEMVADYLLENGVIVPSVKLGERRIDDLGRIHIPKDVRLSLDINYGDVISISVSDASIVLKKEREQK